MTYERRVVFISRVFIGSKCLTSKLFRHTQNVGVVLSSLSFTVRHVNNSLRASYGRLPNFSTLIFKGKFCLEVRCPGLIKMFLMFITHLASSFLEFTVG